MTDNMKATEYWYLRSGDFRPERLDASNAGYRDRHTAIEQLAEANNLFTSKRDATIAYHIVSGVLSSLNIEECSPENERQFSEQSTVNPQCSDTSDNAGEIHLTIHIHS